MTIAADLSRKERRSRIARAAKIYGIKGEESLAIHEAYGRLARKELTEALQLVHPISQSHPKNPHPWIILGGAALEQREGRTALAFFGEAKKHAPRNVNVLEGLAKAHVLEAEVEPAVLRMEEAFAAGCLEPGLIALYTNFMAGLERRSRAIQVLAPIAAKQSDAQLCLQVADLHVGADEHNRAVDYLLRAHRLAPNLEEARIGRLSGLIYAQRFEEAEAYADELLPEVQDRDPVIVFKALALRFTGRAAAASELIDGHDFSRIEKLAEARSVQAMIQQDLGDVERAEASYLEALHVCGDDYGLAKAFGSFSLRFERYEQGLPNYHKRIAPNARQLAPLENTAKENLATRTDLIVLGEQGVGDQLALLPLMRLAGELKARITFVGDERMGPLLQGNALGIEFAEAEGFFKRPEHIDRRNVIFLGDLASLLPGADMAAMHGAYLRPDPDQVAGLRQKYQAQAGGRPIIGTAFASTSLRGHLRSIPLARLVERFPENALVVNLQYGDCAQQIAAAKAARPDLTFYDDEEVDQMTDLAAFAAQIAAIDHVVTIDNTTAHVCGALGHPKTDVLIPRGAECMWYWGPEGTQDRWYGTLRLHRQTAVRDWSAPLEGLRRSFADA